MHVQHIDYQSPQAKQEFYHSLKETGFAVFSNHPIDNELVKKVHNEWREFYHQGSQHQYPWLNATQEGYAPFRMENARDNDYQNLMEFYNVYNWGLYPNEVSGDALKLHNQMSRLAKLLLGWLDEELPKEVCEKLSMPLSQMVKASPNHLMRIIHYPPLTGDEHPAEIRAAEHADSNLLTLLPAPSMPGLQVKVKDHDWMDVDYTKGDLVVNIGDMMNECTGNFLQATLHRVVNPEGEAARKERMSTPIFIHPRDEVRLSDQYTAKEYSNAYLSDNGVLDLSEDNND